MYASGTIMGRIVDKEIVYIENESTAIEFTLAVKRNIKNADGKYPTDLFKIKATDNVAKKYFKFAEKENMIAVSVRIQTKLTYIDQVSYFYQTEFIAKDVTLIAESLVNWREIYEKNTITQC